MAASRALAMTVEEKNKLILKNVPSVKVVAASFEHIRTLMGRDCTAWKVIPEKSQPDHGGFAIVRECRKSGAEGIGGVGDVKVEGSIEVYKGKPRSLISNISFDFGT